MVARHPLGRDRPGQDTRPARAGWRIRRVVSADDQCRRLDRRTRRLIPDEVGVLKRMLTKLRRSAWLFAINMAVHPDNARQSRVNQAAWTAALGAWYLQPPARLTALPVLVRVIAKRESRDVAGNIRALEGITNTPEKLNKAYL